MKLLDGDHPFFAPLWRRIAIVVLTLGWAIFEFVAGGPIWGALFLAIGLWCCYEFFVAFGSPGDDEDKG